MWQKCLFNKKSCKKCAKNFLEWIRIRFLRNQHWQIPYRVRNDECNRHSEALATAPRTKQVHSNSNRKNTFSDYEFSIFTLSWISSTLTEFRQRNFVPKASICSLSGMNGVQKFAETSSAWRVWYEKILGKPISMISTYAFFFTPLAPLYQ